MSYVGFRTKALNYCRESCVVYQNDNQCLSRELRCLARQQSIFFAKAALFVTTKIHICRESRVVCCNNRCFSRHIEFFCDRSYSLAINRVLVATDQVLLRQIEFCRDRSSFVATDRVLSRQILFCRDRTNFFATIATNRFLSRPIEFCRDSWIGNAFVCLSLRILCLQAP